MEDMRSEKILKEVKKLMNDDVSFLDAIEHYAFKNDIEVELIGEVIRRSKVLKALAMEDAENMNLIEKTNRLPV